MNTFLAAAVASSSVALHAHAMQEVPPVRPVPPPPPSNSLVSAPAPGSTAVALPPQTETWVLNSPVPTVSPTWGYRATVMGERIFVGGPERAVSPGACGQLCMWERVNGEWKADPNLFQVERVGTGAFVLQRLERGGNFIFSAVDRRGPGTSVRVLEPQGGRVVESGSLILPAEADLPSFASSFASDGNAVAIGSADLRFNLKEESLKRNRDPKVFLYSREGSVWKLDGFVKTPAQANGAPADPCATLARYLLNMALCESLYSPLQLCEIALRNAMNEELREEYIADCERVVKKWNATLERMEFDQRISLPDRRFHRRQGLYAGHTFNPAGELISPMEFEAKRTEWLPTDADRAYVQSLMKPVHTPGQMASWIAAPKRGINRQPVEYQYVRTDG